MLFAKDVYVQYIMAEHQANDTSSVHRYDILKSSIFPKGKHISLDCNYVYSHKMNCTTEYDYLYTKVTNIREERDIGQGLLQ